MTIGDVMQALSVAREFVQFAASVIALGAALSARRTAKKAVAAAATAQDAAETAGQRASDAVREQINFALQRAAKEAVNRE